MYIQLKECMNDSFTGDYEDMNKKQLLCVVNNLEKVWDTCVYMLLPRKSPQPGLLIWHCIIVIQAMGSSSIKVKNCNLFFLILWRIYIHWNDNKTFHFYVLRGIKWKTNIIFHFLFFSQRLEKMKKSAGDNDSLQSYDSRVDKKRRPSSGGSFASS